jgi:hypothetical protein
VWDLHEIKLNLPLDVKTEYLDSVVVLSIHGLLPRVELLALVDVLTAGIATPT